MWHYSACAFYRVKQYANSPATVLCTIIMLVEGNMDLYST